MNQRTSSDSASTNNSGTVRLIIVTVAVVALLLGGFYIWLNRAVTEPVVSTQAPVTRSAVQTESPSPVQLPVEAAAVEEAPLAEESTPSRSIVAPPVSIESSDAAVKLAVADLAPGIASWIVSEQQIRKWVLAVDLMADGDVPKSYRPVSYPLTRFEPDVRGAEPDQQFSMKADSYKRTDLFVSAFVAIDPGHLVQYYKAWLPLLEKAYVDQGKKDKFDQRLRAALQRVVDVKPLPSIPMLKKRGGVIYVYADEKLEAATDVEKMLWRMGPDNSLKIQNYVKQIQQRLPK